MIYTVGYQRLPIRRLAELIDCLGVDLLVDCRKRPFSHINGYSSGSLLQTFGDKYVMKGDILGGGGNTSQAGIDWIADQKQKNILLMCMEDYPLDCHRHTAICAPHFPDALHYYNGVLATAADMERAHMDGDGGDVPVYARIIFEGEPE